MFDLLWSDPPQNTAEHKRRKYYSVYSSTEPGNLYSNGARFEIRVHKKSVILKI